MIPFSMIQARPMIQSNGWTVLPLDGFDPPPRLDRPPYLEKNKGEAGTPKG